MKGSTYKFDSVTEPSSVSKTEKGLPIQEGPKTFSWFKYREVLYFTNSILLGHPINGYFMIFVFLLPNYTWKPGGPLNKNFIV